MASTIIASEVTTPVSTSAGDVVIIDDSGSISVVVTIFTGITTNALLLTGDQSEAYISGGINIIDGNGLYVDEATSHTVVEISETGRIVAIRSESGINAGGLGISVWFPDNNTIVNRGHVQGSIAGIALQYNASAGGKYSQVIDNSGQILSDQYGIYAGLNDSATINNSLTGVIQADEYAIYGDNTQMALTVNNFGSIVGSQSTGAAISASGPLELNNHGLIVGQVNTNGSEVAKFEATGATIINTGEMQSGEDGVAIDLGDGADLVKNKGGAIAGDIFLGGGNDKVVYKGQTESVIIINGHNSKDPIIDGGGGRDKFVVKTKAKLEIHGGDGKDTIVSKVGKHIVDGGAGKDTITLGKGKQTVVHEAGDGTDKVFKFKLGKDRIDLSDHDFGGFDALQSASVEKGDKVVIDLTGSDKMVVKGVGIDDLSSDDFIL